MARVLRSGRKDLYASLAVHAANLPNKVALASGDKLYTYAQLDDRSRRFASGLLALGAQRKDKIVIALGNSAEHVLTVAGATHAGCVAVPMSTHYKAGEAEHVLTDAGANIVCLTSGQWKAFGGSSKVTPKFLAGKTLLMTGAREGWPSQAIDWNEVSAEPLPDSEAPDTDASLMLYTSGTTGKAKGAMLDMHRVSFFRAFQLLGACGFSKHTRFFTACPAYHAAPTAFVGFTLLAGGTVFLSDHFEATETWRELNRLGITAAFFVPTQIVRLLSLPPDLLAQKPLALERMISGGAPLAVPTKVRALQTFGPMLYDFYGATELGLVSIASPAELQRKPATIGRPFPGVDARFFSDDGQETKTGEIGELFITSDQLNFNYYNNQEATERTFRGKYRSVGDLGYYDEEGLLFVVDRRSDMIISGGVNIYPAEIENELLAHPAIADAAVVGIPDAEWGESVCAFVVRGASHPDKGATQVADAASLSADDVIAYCGARLASLKKPKRVVFVDELPRSPQGKVLKRELREQLRS